MTKKKKKVEMRADGVIVVDGQEFRMKTDKGKIIEGHQHPDKWIYTAFDKETYEEDVEFIIKNIEMLVTKEELIKEILTHYPLDIIRAVRKSIEKGEPITKSEGCITINFGKKETLTLVG
ncbi:MAG: hypothetical protein PVI03_06665 [Candidatus Thorarchaeota archaeon]